MLDLNLQERPVLHMQIRVEVRMRGCDKHAADAAHSSTCVRTPFLPSAVRQTVGTELLDAVQTSCRGC